MKDEFDDYDDQIISGDKYDLKFLTFVLRTEGDYQKKLQPEN